MALKLSHKPSRAAKCRRRQSFAVQSRATLFLGAGTYLSSNFAIEPQAKISCTTSTEQVVIHV
jgi:hypothetical protein